MKKFYSYFKLIRPHHWIKNFLIFAPLIFGGYISNFSAVLHGIYLFFAFSALASAVYVLNDIADQKQDRLHPRKQHRPIAAQQVSQPEAIFLVFCLLGIVIILSYSFSPKVLLILSAYFLINVLYSFWLKHIVLIDIFLVASMYLMRIFAGGKLLNIPISHWLILCTFFLALFLISAKRRSEFCSMTGEQSMTRRVIQDYNKDFLDHILTITTTASLVSYGLYAASVDKPYLLYSLIFVTFGFFRYLYLVYRYNIGEAPEHIIFVDPWIISTVITWGIYTGIIFYIF